MLILALGLGLTTLWLVKAGYRHGSHGTQLGSMSQSWVVEYNASQPSRSE
jgi:hypothetical protein